MPNLVVAIRNAAGNLPTGPDLATATVPGFCNGAGGYFTATFATPATITATTQYALVWRTAAPVPGGTPPPGYFGTVSTGTGSIALQNPYAGGRRVSSGNGGATWAGAAGNANNDHGFRIYVNQGYSPSGNLVSSAKDANPATGALVNWGTLSWTADTPAGTGVTFQAAASSNPAGPFTYVGPDGTAATSFANGASLSQFNGQRYLRYRAALATSTPSATPAVHDVSVCFDDVPSASTLAVAPATGVFGGTADLSATLTGGSTPLAGKLVSFSLNGTPAGSSATNASGVATLFGVSLAGIGGGTYPAGVAASFAGDAGYAPSSGSAELTVTRASQTITFGAIADRTFGDADFTVAATASSGLPVAFAAGGDCTVAGALVHITGAGTCTIVASQLGSADYEPAPDVPQSFDIARAGQTITFGPLAARTFGDPDFTVAATASSALTVSFSASGNCTVMGATVHITGAGACTIVAAQAGNDDYEPAPDVPQSFAIGRASQTITFGPLPTRTIGEANFTVSATASSGLGVAFSASGDCTVSGAVVHLVRVGSCSITASQPGNANYDPAPSVTRSFPIAYAGCVVRDDDDDDRGRGGRDDDDRRLSGGSRDHGDRDDDRDDDRDKPKHGSTVMIKLTLCSATGANLSSPSVIVTALRLVNARTGQVKPVEDAGNSNPGNRFRFDRGLTRGGGYVFHLSTKGLSDGTWHLIYSASGDSTLHTYVLKLR
jgi:hypothetical protein